jgi:hypothetical protein
MNAVGRCFDVVSFTETTEFGLLMHFMVDSTSKFAMQDPNTCTTVHLKKSDFAQWKKLKFRFLKCKGDSDESQTSRPDGMSLFIGIQSNFSANVSVPMGAAYHVILHKNLKTRQRLTRILGSSGHDCHSQLVWSHKI